MNLWLIAAVAAGGALGSVARYGAAGALQPANASFPYGIFLVNVVGSLLMGAAIGLAATRLTMAPEVRAFLAVGVLGGFTTFSTFALDAALLIQRAQYLLAGLYMGGSVLLSVLALFLGLWLVRLL